MHDPVRGQLVHRTQHRARLAFPRRRRDRAFFARLERELSELAPVDSVRVDPRTGTVLVYHRGELREVLALARERRLFAVEAAPHRTPLFHLHAGVRWADAWLRSVSEGRIDLQCVGVLWLAGAGLWQVTRGHVLPAGFSLLWQAGVLGMYAGSEMRSADMGDGSG